MTELQIKLYYEALKFQCYVHSFKEFSELDMKHLMEISLGELLTLVSSIKEGE